MARAVELNPAAALADRVTVDSLWEYDSLSQRFREFDASVQSMNRAAVSEKTRAESFEKWASIEASGQEKQVIAAVEVWCGGKQSCAQPICWPDLTINENFYRGGEVDAALSACFACAWCDDKHRLGRLANHKPCLQPPPCMSII